MRKARKSAAQLEREFEEQIERIEQRILEQDYRYDMEEWKNVSEMMDDFRKTFGKWKFCDAFKFLHPHLRGNNLTFYFKNQFAFERFENDAQLSGFKKKLGERYNFRAEIENGKII